MRVLVTGGAGFVGCNLADRLRAEGHEVKILDNLSRPGVELNLEWLRSRHGRAIEFVRADVRDYDQVQRVVADVEGIFHLAGQVAVTTSVTDPREDFETNALGTLNVLEAVRTRGGITYLLFSSTNKVYGALAEFGVAESPGAYHLRDLPAGVPESAPLDFFTPYGCSKGAADQYVRDYCRIYGLPTVVFRMSCIYGPHQLGTEDQGWVMHFVRSVLEGRPIVIYGDGKQVRDVLYVDDLVDAFLLAADRICDCAGKVYNIGGGPANAMPILEVFEHLKSMGHATGELSFEDWRWGDQKVYVSDISRAAADLAWEPRTTKAEGLRRLVEWAQENLVLPG
jgi:CDP-paratose 2-epimerase